MVDGALTCPNCGSPEVVTIQLPRHTKDHAVHTTQTGLRCKNCGTQWTDREEWLREHGGD